MSCWSDNLERRDHLPPIRDGGIRNDLWVLLENRVVSPWEDVGLPGEDWIRLLFRTFSEFFDTGCLKYITSLALYTFDPSLFVNHRDNAFKFKEALHSFPRILDELQFLIELAVWRIGCNSDDLEGLPRTKSLLCSREVNFSSIDSGLVAAFLNIFADCNIDHICIDAHLLREVELHFGNVKCVCVKVSDISPSSSQRLSANICPQRLRISYQVYCLNKIPTEIWRFLRWYSLNWSSTKMRRKIALLSYNSKISFYDLYAPGLMILQPTESIYVFRAWS